MATQIDITSLETVIQPAVQASVAAMSEAICPMLTRSRSSSGSSHYTTRDGHTRTWSPNCGNRNDDSSRSSRSSSRSRSPHKRRFRSPSRRSCTRSKSRHSSPRTSLGHAWTAAGSSNQPASWMLFRRTKRKILAGEYVDFDTILTEVTTNKGGVPMAMKASVSGPKHRHVCDIGLWLQAWSAYAATVLLADPPRGYELIGYQSIVAQARLEYQTSASLKYNRTFRYYTSRTTGVTWDTINHHMWA